MISNEYIIKNVNGYIFANLNGSKHWLLKQYCNILAMECDSELKIKFMNNQRIHLEWNQIMTVSISISNYYLFNGKALRNFQLCLN